MNSKQRVDAVIRGEMPDRVPVCLHNFLPAVEEAGMRLEDYLTDPDCAAKAHLQAVETYGHDCIFIDLDTTMLRRAARRCVGEIGGRRCWWLQIQRRIPPISPILTRWRVDPPPSGFDNPTDRLAADAR